MTKADVITYCHTFSNAAMDAPFENNDAVVFRRSSSRKWFVLLLTVDGEDAVNLKCDPRRAELYRSVYRDVNPGWHMNKTHWNTIRLGGDVPDAELREMIIHSYELTASQRTKSKAKSEEW